MKLVNPEFLFKIEFEENKITNIIIESQNIFEAFVNELYTQIEGEEGLWVLSENSTPLELKKYCEIIINPFALDINNKKILSKLYDDIKKNSNSTELYVKWNELYPNLANVIEALINDFDYDLEFNDEIDMKDFLKMMNLKFSSNFNSSLERMIDYMNLHNKILGTKLFILINMKSFYSEDKLQYLFEQAFYKKYNILLIENKEYEKVKNNEIKYIIDKDSCVISNKM